MDFPIDPICLPLLYLRNWTAAFPIAFQAALFMSERTHRHQLEKNILADWLGEKIELLKPYGTQIAVGGLIVLAAVIGAIYYFSRTDTVGPRAWQAYFTAFGEQKVDEALQDVFQKSEVKGTAAELWARLSYADQRFQFAVIQGSQDPTAAKEALGDAEEALVEVEKRASEPALMARTRYSLARIYETQGKPNRAREYYQKVAESAKNSALAKAAAEGAERLDPKGEVVEVLAWLAEQKPPTTKMPGSDSFLDSLGPGFGQPAPTLPERPNLNVPGSDSPFGPSGAGGIDFGKDDPSSLKGDDDDAKAPPPAKAAEETEGKEPPAKGRPAKGEKTDEGADEKTPPPDSPAKAESSPEKQATDEQAADDAAPAEKPAE